MTATAVVTIKENNFIKPIRKNSSLLCIRLEKTDVKQCSKSVIDISLRGRVIELSATICASTPDSEKSSNDKVRPKIRLNVKALSIYCLVNFFRCTMEDPIPVSEKLANITRKRSFS